MKNQLLENREALGKFRDNSKTTETGEDGYWEFFHLVGYAVFPSIDWRQCSVTIEEKNIAACIVVYNNIMKSQKFILSAHELKLEDNYVDINSLSESDKLKILLAVKSCKSFSSLYASIRFSSFDIEVKTLNSTCE